MILRLPLLLLSFCFFITCGDSSARKAQDKQGRQENKTSLPDMTDLQQLSPADKVKLANAKGKTAKPKTLKALLEVIDSDSDALMVFSFWSLKEPLSIQQNLALHSVQRELGEETIKVHPVCIDQRIDPMAINAHLREFGFQNEAFYLQDSLPRRWHSQFDAAWQGSLPAMLFSHKDTETRLFYQQALSFEELLAILQTLTL